MYNHLLNKHTTTTDSSERYIFYFVSIMKASGGVYCAVYCARLQEKCGVSGQNVASLIRGLKMCYIHK